MSATSVQQAMLWLAFSAGADSANHYVKDCSTATQLYGLIGQRLATLKDQTGASWSPVWGPAIYSFPINVDGRHIDNAVYVVQQADTNNYAIAIAGTDPYSLADWVLEDFLVAATIPWFLEIGWNPRPRISLATFNGLTILLNIAPPCAPLPGNGQQLVKFLSTITGAGPINLYTTGHSLGGALAPSLTLALDDLRLLWDPLRHATFLPFAFAGPTPGDAAFAGYFQSKLPGLQRIWNSLDIVPHAWDTPHMEELPSIYGQPPLQAVTDLVNAIVGKIGPIGYTPLTGQGATFTGTQQNPHITTIGAYLIEAGYQHVNAYAIWAGFENWPKTKLTL